MSNVKTIVYTHDFFKNINKKLKRNILPKDTGYTAANLRYDSEYGALEKRLSRATYNSASYAASTFFGMHRYYKNSTGSAALIFGIDGDLKIGYDADGAASDLKTGISSNFLSFQTYKDLEYIVNGSENNMVFGLTSKTSPVFDMGVPSTTVPVATISVAAGNLSGNVIYATTFQFDGYQEGSIGPSTAATNVNGSKTTISMPISASTRCTGRYLYRSKAGGSVLYRLATVADNTTSAYIDNIADSSLDTTISGPVDYGVPNSYRFICLHKERIFLANNSTYQSRIIFSDIRSGTSYPDVFPASNYFDIGRDEGDEITAIKNDHYGQFVVFKENSVRIIDTSSDSPRAWSITDPLSNQGCISPYSAVTTPIGIIYLTRFGENRKRLVLWNGQHTVLIPELEGIEPLLTQIPDNTLGNIVGHYHNGYYYLSYRDVLSGGLYSNKVMAIDIFNNWAVAVDDKNAACFSSWNGGSDWGEFYAATSDGTGTIYREDTDTYDFFLRYKSEFDEGTFSRTATAGTEVSPSLTFGAGVADTFGALTWATMTGTANVWASLSGTFDTWWIGGEWYSAINQISAKALSRLFWNKSNAEGTDIAMYIRTGDSIAACEAANWSGPYYVNTGDDISSVSAGKYVQVKIRLLTQFYSTVSDVAIVRGTGGDDDYAVKISANFGTPAETAIEFDWESGRIDLGDINEVYKRLRKRIRSVKIEYEAGSSTGNFDFRYYFNGSSTQAGSFNTSFTTYSESRIYNFPLNTFCDDFIYRLYSNSDVEKFKIRKVTFVLNVEPYKVLRGQL